MNHPRLHKDDDFVQSIEKDKCCLDTLHEYEDATYISSGAFGIVLKVAHKDIDYHPLVIKIMPRTAKKVVYSEREISRALRVTKQLGNYLPVFSKSYGWIACGPVTFFNWVTTIRKGLKNAIPLQFNPYTEQCYYIVSEYGNGITLAKHEFGNVLQCQVFFFELLHSLQLAYQMTGFHHNDLHASNILVIAQDPDKLPSPRVYKSLDPDHYMVIPPTYLQPMIIDYGFATLGYADELADALARVKLQIYEIPIQDQQAYRDQYLHKILDPPRGNADMDKVVAFLAVFPHNVIGPMRDVYKLIRSMIYLNTQSLAVEDWLVSLFAAATRVRSIAELLSQPTLFPLEVFYENRYQPVFSAKCMICGNVAVQKFEHAPTYQFCEGTACAQTLGPIGHLVQ